MGIECPVAECCMRHRKYVHGNAMRELIPVFMTQPEAGPDGCDEYIPWQ
jgi:hypothetical protein